MKSLPQAFTDRMRTQLGDEADAFFSSLNQPSPVSIRLHHSKGRASFDLAEKVPWCETGYYLASRPGFHLDPHWHAGAYYVQEASSMILDYILQQLHLDERPRTWIDLCAAPGGKTGILAKFLKATDVLIANEVVGQRRNVLRENLTKAGFLNTFLTSEPASSFNQPLADVMLIDAPCAGEGMMRKDTEAITQWHGGLVQSCSRLQQEMVLDAVQCLNPGGYLIYSTCSYSMDENILNVERFMARHGLKPVSLHFPASFHLATIRHGEALGYQFYPHRVKGEGLFISVLQHSSDHVQMKVRSRKSGTTFEAPPSWFSSHVSQSNPYWVRKGSASGEFILADALPLAQEILHRMPRAEIIAQAGELKGKDFIPSHFLAMSNLAAPDYPVMDIPFHTALDYLERHTSLPQPASFGWHLVRYEGSLLGWAKYTPQGWKNHYPKAWHLRQRGAKQE